jgi:ABC-2 type transport system permease protein
MRKGVDLENANLARGRGPKMDAGRSPTHRVGIPRLLGHYVRFNLSAGMEYRVSFLTQVLGMALNNSAFLIFWIILYGVIPDIKGYVLQDVLFLWSLMSTGYGMSAVLLGNAPYLSRTIYNGELDVYLLQPKPILINFLASRMNVAGFGDISYGILLYAFTQPITFAHVGLFITFCLFVMILLTAVEIFYHSLSFFIGNAEEFAGTAAELSLTFTLYPGSIFKGASAFLLHSLVPAALIAYIPLELFRSFSPGKFALLVAGDAAILLSALAVFRLGLRRYESGNRMGTRI